jgi:hypothetical protein
MSRNACGVEKGSCERVTEDYCEDHEEQEEEDVVCLSVEGVAVGGVD